MSRGTSLVLLCLLTAALAACVVHTDRLLDEGPNAAASHASGCAVPLTLVAVQIAVSFLPLIGSLPRAPAPARARIRSVSLFQPPELVA